ncbi:VanZ family protein [Streptomyces sp. AC495_CC817]|uniref:VanZ family protein n=1 Tax=Streptomyces sp. AC495_CC817 TaxID=2823900 RepID=UPI001C2747FD|nr:VanZ family protein [Streptomyces sp. AC495_CC817]
MRPEIPAVTVLAPIVAAMIVVLLRRLRGRDALTGLRAATVVTACVYAAGVIGHTLFPIPLGPDPDAQPWYVWVNLVPFTDIVDDPSGLALNVLLFVPLGVLLPLLASRVTVWRVLAAGALTSLGIELVQLLADLAVGLRRVADIDDLIANTAGALLGYAVFRLVTRVPAVAAVAERASWPERKHAGA